MIVVDDGSTDGTSAVLASYGDQIRTIRQKPSGVSAARNAAIRVSSGEFIAFLDADDFWAPEKLELQMQRFADPRVGLVYSDFVTRYSNGTVRESYLEECPLACEGDVLDSYVRSRFILPSAVILRRRCIEEFGGFDESFKISEDLDLFARIFTRWHAAQVRLPLSTRFEAAHNLTADRRRTNDDTILALEKVRRSDGIKPAVRSAIGQELGRQYWWQGYRAFERADMGAARRSLLKAIRNDLRNLKTCLPTLVLTLLPASLRDQLRRARGEAPLGSDRGVLEA